MAKLYYDDFEEIELEETFRTQVEEQLGDSDGFREWEEGSFCRHGVTNDLGDNKLYKLAVQVARDIFKMLYAPNNARHLLKDYGDVMSQIQRNSTSIAANIAEGAGRNTIIQKIQYLGYARGSFFELLAFFDCLPIPLTDDQKENHKELNEELEHAYWNAVQMAQLVGKDGAKKPIPRNGGNK